MVGADDAEYGQAVHAFVTIGNDAVPEQTELELLELARQELADYMVPESVTVLPKMPRTGSGKLDRARLQWIAESSDNETIAILLS